MVYDRIIDSSGDLATLQDVKDCINDFCIENDVENMKKDTQNTWHACMMYLYMRLFAPRKGSYQNPNGSYKLDIVNYYMDLYIYICGIYNKEICIHGFSSMLYINRVTIYTWNKDIYINNILYNGLCLNDNNNSIIDSSGDMVGDPAGENVSCNKINLYKKLVSNNERSLQDLLASGKNPVGILGILNKKHGWADNRQVVDGSQDKPIIARKDVLQLPNNQNTDSTGIL